MDTKTTHYKEIKIITYKLRKGGYESFMFLKGKLQAFDNTPKMKLQRQAIQYAESMIDTQKECGYI